MKKLFSKLFLFILITEMLFLQAFNIGLVVCFTSNGEVKIEFAHDGKNCACCIEEACETESALDNMNFFLSKVPRKCCTDIPLSIDKADRTSPRGIVYTDNSHRIQYEVNIYESSNIYETEIIFSILKIPIKAPPGTLQPSFTLRI
ncbi:hypothetical protein ACFL6G_03395 [candidate division KSB1 bacterium]